MLKHILIMIGVILLLLPSCLGVEYITLNYTETYNVVEYNMIDDQLYINIPSGNYIDFVEYRPKFIPFDYKIRNINTTLYYSDDQYKIVDTITTTSALLNLFSSNLDFKLELYINDQQNYLKEYDQKVFESCLYTNYQKLSFGNSADITDNQINIDTHIISNKGKIRYNDVLSVYDCDSYLCGNISIEKNNFDDLNMFIGYRLESVKSKEYYISLLSPTLQMIYSTGFNWLDKDNYLLNIMLITDYIITTMSFWLIVISQNLAILTFIIMIFVIPFLAYYNSQSQSGFFNNLVLYYSKVINLTLNFIKYMVYLILKCLEIARSLIPFV